MALQVTIKSVFGRELIYPVCETARLFARLVEQETLTLSQINIIKGLGYKVEVQSEKREL